MAFQHVLSLRAGSGAIRAIAGNGVSPASVGALAGAAGGPKWLILSALDRYIFGEWLPASKQPIELVGSSIGAWRFAAACHPGDPVAAIDGLEDAYIAQTYSRHADRNEISGTVAAMLDSFLSNDVIDGVLTHPRYRLHAITVRSRGLTAYESRAMLGAGSSLAALANAFSRRTLGTFFERVVFSRSRSTIQFAADGVATRTVALTAANARDAVYASGNVPMIMRGVVDPAGAPRGVYRDGGIVDYHIDHPIMPEPPPAAALVLMPHFDCRLVPGWFDKSLFWRKSKFASNTLLVGPGPALLKRLVGERVPDRKDFRRYADCDRDRVAAWEKAIDAGKWMRDAFEEFTRCENPVQYVRPL